MPMGIELKEHPILFSGTMVRAILDGRKMQTRRVIKPQPKHGVSRCQYSKTGWAETFEGGACRCAPAVRCPYGEEGDRLWVRETFCIPQDELDTPTPDICYRADRNRNTKYTEWPWRPSIHMPRWASRILLRVNEVRVERLQDISMEDCWAEGFDPEWYHSNAVNDPENLYHYTRGDFRDLWDCLNAKRGFDWEKNPWVWVVTFERIEGESRAEVVGA